jgi:hypothetical protein
MTIGEVLTHWTVYIAFASYASSWVVPLNRFGASAHLIAKLLRTLACVLLVLHVLLAFGTYHGWSHRAACEHTARATDIRLGLNWGGGVYFNYALLVVWIADTLCCWLWSQSYEKRWIGFVWATDGFIAFMWFNATVVFGTGLIRWAGLIVCLWLAMQYATTRPCRADADHRHAR